MKKLYSCLVALLCVVALTLPAMADVLPRYGIGISGVLILILLGIAAIAAAILVVVLSHRKK